MYDNLTPDEARTEARKVAARAMELTAQPDWIPFRLGRVTTQLDTVSTAASYWRAATAMLQAAGDLTAEERCTAWALIARGRWTGTLDDLVTTVRAITTKS